MGAVTFNTTILIKIKGHCRNEKNRVSPLSIINGKKLPAEA